MLLTTSIIVLNSGGMRSFFDYTDSMMTLQNNELDYLTNIKKNPLWNVMDFGATVPPTEVLVRFLPELREIIKIVVNSMRTGKVKIPSILLKSNIDYRSSDLANRIYRTYDSANFKDDIPDFVYHHILDNNMVMKNHGNTKSQLPPTAITSSDYKTNIIVRNDGFNSINDYVRMAREIHILWATHIDETRYVIISASSGRPDLPIVLESLKQNQRDIGRLFSVYFGKKVGNAVTSLLLEHIDGAVKIVGILIKIRDKVIMKVGKRGTYKEVIESILPRSQELAEAIKEWRSNGDQISKALHNLNPKVWILDDDSNILTMGGNGINTAISQHLLLTTQEAISEVIGNYDNSWKSYKKAKQQALDNIALTLYNGIIDK